jgi:hypothetical protein
MDKELRANLVRKLSGEKGFDPTYTQQNREWFVGAVLDAIAATTADNDLEVAARGIITSANANVKADRDFTVGVPLDKKTKIERKDIARRVETIYGVIGQNKDLADTSHDSLRRFLFKRRYRGVVRMVYHVNPNSNGFMRYPNECPQWGKMRLNDDARPLWVTANPPQTVPLRVTDQGDPELAALEIWDKPFADPCTGPAAC